MANSLPEDALHKILGKIQTQVVTTQRELSLVRSQIASKQRELKMGQLTVSQLTGSARRTSPSATVAVAEGEDEEGYYRSVGKMFLQDTRTAVLKELEETQRANTDQIGVLEKKQKYLEKQAAEAQAHLKDIFVSVDRQSQAA